MSTARHAGSPVLRQAIVDRRKPLCEDTVKRFQKRCKRMGVLSLILLGMANHTVRDCLKPFCDERLSQSGNLHCLGFSKKNPTH